MKRRSRSNQSPTNERWLVSYADFITLLFAFFVVMYAVSSVNDGKYRVLSHALIQAFNPGPREIDPIQMGILTRGGQLSVLEGGTGLGPGQWAPASDSLVEMEDTTAPTAAGQDAMGYMMDEIARTLSTYMDQDLIEVTRGETWVEIEVKSSLLFDSGSARLSREALAVLQKIAAILKPLQNSIRVEGFTDNVPINTLAYPSNWELSAARAASVVHLFARLGIQPERLAATGYGEFQPVADNNTEEGRNANRRVVVVVFAGSKVRRPMDYRATGERLRQQGLEGADSGRDEVEEGKVRS